MGLDVYLGKSKDLEAANALEEQYEERSSEVWKEAGEYDNLTDEQKKEIRERTKKLAVSMGLDEDGGSPLKIDVEEKNSEKYPDHYFKIGYFRSSYNDGGVNRVCERYGLPYDLYSIFEPNDEYYVKPDWNKALERVNEQLVAFEKLMTTRKSKLGVIKVDTINPFMGDLHSISSEEEALNSFLKVEETHKERGSDMESFSNQDGDFFLDGIKCLAMIKGRSESFTGRTHPAVYMIYEREGEEDSLAWYMHAFEIVKETIEFILAQEDSQDYYLRWSS